MSILSLRKDLADIKTSVTNRGKIHLIRENDKIIIGAHLPEGDERRRIYIPSSTAKLFHEDKESLVRPIKGPFGSGKSTLCMMDIVMNACDMPAWWQGKRKSKWAIIRNTTGELETTTLQTWLYWFSELGDVISRKKPIITVEHIFNIDDGSRVEMEILFLALDREDDLKKIRSLEISGAYINEISESPQGILGQLQGRISRYPNKSICDYHSFIIADTNPPDTDHWFYKVFEEERPPKYRIFSQPPGLIKNAEGEWMANKEAENIRNVGESYYTNLAIGQTEEFIKVFCCGEYGSVIFGKKVYPEYNDDVHAVDNLELIEGLPLYGGLDGGLTPALILFQISKTGQFRVLKEFCGYDIWLEQFFESLIIPSLNRQFYGFKVEDIFYDPSGIKKNDGYGDTYGDILRKMGFNSRPGRTNDIQPRIDAVKYFLTRMAGGEPSFLMDKKECPTLRKGFLGEYKYKRLRLLNEERYQDKPDKNYVSHPHDALHYGALEFSVFGAGYKTQYDLSDFINPAINVL